MGVNLQNNLLLPRCRLVTWNVFAMKKRLFKLLVKLNNNVLPKYTGKDPAKLNKVQQAVLGFRYWALINSL